MPKNTLINTGVIVQQDQQAPYSVSVPEYSVDLIRLSQSIQDYINGIRSVVALSGSTSHTLTTSNDVVLCDATVGATTVTLPSPSLKRVYVIKKTDISANAVIINTPSGTIDGSATQSILFQYDSLSVASDGTNYFLI
jgi:hypothetical protein